MSGPAQARPAILCTGANLRDRIHEGVPAISRSGRGRGFHQSLDRIHSIMHAVQHALSRGRANARQELHQPEAGDTITRVLDKTGAS
jgi:hypothetical protein